MAEDEENPCEFKAVCNFSHKVTDETCGYHLVKNIEDCPLHKFAIRIRKDLAEKVKEEIGVLLERFNENAEEVHGENAYLYRSGLGDVVEVIEDLLQDGGD